MVRGVKGISKTVINGLLLGHKHVNVHWLLTGEERCFCGSLPRPSTGWRKSRTDTEKARCSSEKWRLSWKPTGERSRNCGSGWRGWKPSLIPLNDLGEERMRILGYSRYWASPTLSTGGSVHAWILLIWMPGKVVLLWFSFIRKPRIDTSL